MNEKNKFTATFMICCVFCCVFATGIISTALAGDAASDNNTSNSSVTNSTIQIDKPSAPGLAPLNPAFVEYQKKQAQKNNIQSTRMISGTSQIEESDLIPSPVDLGHLSKISVAYTSTLPTSYDLRALNKTIPIKYQNPLGTCWSFATYGSLESYLMPNESWNFSENHMINLLLPSSPEGFDFTPGKGGNMFRSTAYLARWSGPVNEIDDPYLVLPEYSPTELGITVQKHVQNVYFIPKRDNVTDNDEIKWAIINYGAATTAGMYSETSYYNSATNSYYYDGILNGNHGVDIIGWNDSFDKNNFSIIPPGNGAFIVRNSDNTLPQYFYVSYYSNIGSESNILHPQYTNNMICTAENTSNYQHIYQKDPLGWITELGNTVPSTNFWAANNFLANSDELLKAVSFYTTDTDCNYEIYINPTSTDLNSRQLVGNGTIQVAGYHTIKLDKIIPLKEGKKFSIILNLTTPNYNYPIAIETPIALYSSKATANVNESFISPDGKAWADITTFPEFANTNICIKAFTDNGTSEEPVDDPIDDPTTVIPTANFITNVTDGYAPLSVQFNDTSVNETARSWNFGDGSSGIGADPVHTYTTAGDYTVTLTAYNGSSTDTKSVVIHALQQPVLESPVRAYVSNSGGLGNTVQIVDVRNSTVIGDPIPVGNAPQGVAMSKDRKTVYVTNTLSDSVSLISTESNSVIGTLAVGAKYPYDVVASPNTSKIYVTTNEASAVISVIDTATNTNKLVYGNGQLYGIAISPDGSTIYAANGGKAIDVMATSNDTVIKTLIIDGSPRDIVFSPDGKYAYVTIHSGNLASKVAVIDTATYEVIATPSVEFQPAGIAITPDGRRVYVANNGGVTVSVIDTATNKNIGTIRVGAQPFGIAVSPDGSRVCVTNNAGASVSTIDTTNNSVIGTTSVRYAPSGIVIYSKSAKPIPTLSPNIVSFNATHSPSTSAPFVVYFDGSATQGNAINMHWNFGDGTIIDAPNKNAIVTNSYKSIGEYNVTVTATYGEAATNSTTQRVNVVLTPKKPINAEFIGAPLSGTSTLNVQFTDKSTGADRWYYVFGDNGSIIAQSPAHIYNKPGSYSVAQIAFNTTTSLYDAIVKKGYVNVADVNGVVPQTVNNIINAPTQDVIINDFTASTTSGSAPLNVVFNSNVTGLANVRTWTWIFEPVGSDYYSTAVGSTSHMFTHVGKFDITLILTNQTGAVASLTKTGYITVSPPSTTGLTYTNSSSDTGLNSFLQASSLVDTPVSNPVSNPVSDISPVVAESPVNTTAPITPITTPVGNGVSSGSNGDTSKISVVSPAAPATFTLYGHVGSAIDFTSTIKTQFIGVTWNFQDGKGSKLANPTHVYTQVGTYPVTLTAQTSDGSYIKKVVGEVIIT